MVFTVQEAHGAVWGMLWEATFVGLGLQTLFGGVLAGFFVLGVLWGPGGVPFWSKNGEYF